MKEKIMNFCFCLFCVVCLFFIFRYNIEVYHVLIFSTRLFLNKVFVSLFPMFLLNDFFIGFGFPYFFYKIFHPFVKRVWRVSGICAYVFIMSLISGTPSNAIILKNLVEEKKITNEEASHYLIFTYFSNPLFLVSMLSMMFPFSTLLKLIFIHYGSNLLIAFIVRKDAPLISNQTLSFSAKKFGDILTKSIKKNVSTLLIILGTISFYMLFTYLLGRFFSLNEFTEACLSGFLEITNGLNNLQSVKISETLKEVIAEGIISFGGLSIHTQIKAILEDTNITYYSFLKGRILQTILSTFLILIF